MILRAGMILTSSALVTGVLHFLRNILIARMISVEDFGIAATFMMTLSVLELISSMSVDRLVVQARDGDDPKLIAALQGISVVRGAMNSILLIVMSWPIAWFFGHPELAWAYQIVALNPLIRAFSHTGMTRHQRKMRFGPKAIAELTHALVTLAAVVPLALWLGDFRVMLGQIMIGVVMTVLMSHLLTPERFRIGWDWAILRRAFDFGWPLLINGGLLFIIMQGDRMVIGNQIGPYELGLFSAALTLAMTPSLIAAKMSRLFFMPLLARRQDDGPALSGVFVVTMQAQILSAAVMAAGMTILGPTIFSLAYGERYAGGLAVLLWLSLMFSMRLIREGSTTVAMSCGRTRLPMAANIVRLVSLPLCFWAASAGWGMVAVVMISTAAEFLSFLVATVLLQRWLGLARLDRLGLPYVLIYALMALAGWIALDPPAVGAFDWRHGAILALLAAIAVVCRELRDRLRTELARKKKP
jgi:O-antigen/teichoic acid export membrane protein